MLGYVSKGFPTAGKALTITMIAAQFPTAPISLSWFHAFISYTHLFVLRGPTPKAFWYTNLLETLAWSLAFKIRSFWYCVQACRTKCQILAVWWISTTQKGLTNSLVLLLLENITATPNKHAWETGKPKHVEITANLGMQKLTLKSICATFSLVTPFFY